MLFAEFLVNQRRMSGHYRMMKLIRGDRFRYRLKKLLSCSMDEAPPYDEVSMFRVMVLQNLYNLSDRKMEGMLYDRLSFRRFCGFGPEATLPDAPTISRF